MASLVRRSRRTFRRRRRTRWDMQTFRLCENEIELTNGAFQADCNDPLIVVTKVLGTSADEIPRARRSLLFGGGHLQLRYNAAIVDHDDCPCPHALHVVSALVKLPLLEDQSTPAYLPNLAVTRTFDSVVAASMADNDEDILWWNSEQMDLLNISCTGGGAQCMHSDIGSGCVPTFFANDIVGPAGYTVAHASALYGRMKIDRRIAVKRRLREREALFLYHAVFSALGNQFADCPTWPLRVNAYLRYAVR